MIIYTSCLLIKDSDNFCIFKKSYTPAICREEPRLAEKNVNTEHSEGIIKYLRFGIYELRLIQKKHRIR